MPRPPIRVEPDLAGEPGPEAEDAESDRALDIARRLGLR
jgi:hypothetical protein